MRSTRRRHREQLESDAVAKGVRPPQDPSWGTWQGPDAEPERPAPDHASDARAEALLAPTARNVARKFKHQVTRSAVAQPLLWALPT